MNAARRAIADDVIAAGRAYDAQQADRLDRLRNLEPETAELLAVLVRATSARANLERAALHGIVELRTAGAAQALTEYDDDSWDFIFLDAERPEYTGYWANLRRVLAPGATLAIDNAISHTDELDAFNRLLKADPHLQSALVPIGAGLILAVDSD